MDVKKGINVDIKQLELAAAKAEKGKSFTQLAMRRFMKNKLAVIGVGVICILIAVSVLAPVLAPHDPNISMMDSNGEYLKLTPPTSDNPLGTDQIGRDVLSRMIYAGRISLSVGLVAVSISLVVGVILGCLAGFYGRWIDGLIMRFTDVVICFPYMFLVITVSTLLKPSIYTVMAVTGLVNWTSIARLVRGEILKLRNTEYVAAVTALGAKNRRIITKHILPNILAPIMVQATLGIATAIITEASLSYLGVGVQPPTASWGNMLNAASSISILQSKPWVWIPPGLAILVTVLSINVIGDGLRDAFDPRANG